MIEVETSKGSARFIEYSAQSPRALLVLGHGAGGGRTGPDLLAIAEALPARGVSVLLHEQPWKVAGKKVAAAPSVLDAGWIESLAVTGPGPAVVRGREVGWCPGRLPDRFGGRGRCRAGARVPAAPAG